MLAQVVGTRRWSLGILLLGILLLGGCQRGGPDDRGESQSPLVGKPAPEVQGVRLDGSKFSLHEQASQHNVVLLDFWATWCGPCVAELPILLELAHEYQDRGVVLFGVNQQEEEETIQRFLRAQAWDLNVVLDPNGDHSQAYGVRGIPQLVLVGRDGLVKQVHVGYSPEIGQVLRQEIDAILASASSAPVPAPAASPAAAPAAPPEASSPSAEDGNNAG